MPTIWHALLIFFFKKKEVYWAFFRKHNTTRVGTAQVSTTRVPGWG